MKNATETPLPVGSDALFGRLRRDEYPEYYAGISENGGAIWTSLASHATVIWHESLPATVATIRQSPWLRSIKGLRWEISLPNETNPASGSNEQDHGQRN